MKTYYKIVEKDPKLFGKVRTLFHGVKGSRQLPRGKWMESQKKWVSDGSGPFYWSGWHVLPSMTVAAKYLERFSKKRLPKLSVVECNIKGEVWPKAHANSPVILAQWIKLI